MSKAISFKPAAGALLSAAVLAVSLAAGEASALIGPH